MFFSKLGLFTHFSHLSTQVKGKPATPTVHTGSYYLPVIYLLGPFSIQYLRSEAILRILSAD